jgi:hypothetical protein
MGKRYTELRELLAGVLPPVYFYRMTAPEYAKTRKMALFK